MVPPNALSDDEKVTVYMGATTSGPFDLPEDCKLRSAVVWLSGYPSDVVFKRSISVIVPHSAVFTSPQHHSMMRFVTCDNNEGPRYKFIHCLDEYIDGQQGMIELTKFVMVAIVAITQDQDVKQVAEGFDSNGGSKDNLSPGIYNGVAMNDIDHAKSLPITQQKWSIPPACYVAKLFWPRAELPSSFRADVHYIQKLPTLMHKV